MWGTLYFLLIIAMFWLVNLTVILISKQEKFIYQKQIFLANKTEWISFGHASVGVGAKIRTQVGLIQCPRALRAQVLPHCQALESFAGLGKARQEHKVHGGAWWKTKVSKWRRRKAPKPSMPCDGVWTLCTMENRIGNAFQMGDSNHTLNMNPTLCLGDESLCIFLYMALSLCLGNFLVGIPGAKRRAGWHSFSSLYPLIRPNIS